MPDDPQEPEGIQSPAVEPGNDPVPGPATHPGQNPLAMPLEGDGVPEKFRGKTLTDVLKSLGELEGKATAAETEATMWRKFWTEQQGRAVNNPQDVRTQPNTPAQPAYNPLEHLDEEQARAVGYIVGVQLAPIYEGVGAFYKEMVRTTRPDFDEFEKRADQIYKEMHPSYRFHPEYGYDYAYRLAKTEKMEPANRIQLPHTAPQVNPPVPKKGPAPLDEVESYWAKKQGLSPEEYRKFGAPVDITKPLGDKQ